MYTGERYPRGRDTRTEFILVLTFVAVAATEAGIDPSKAFFLVSILNGASIVGRFASGFIGDKFGPLNLMIPFMTAAGSLSFGRSIGYSPITADPP